MAGTELAAEREAIEPLLDLSDPGDALTAYYALYHPPALTRLHVHRGAARAADGFLALCTTGADLFRPLVVARAAGDGALRSLLRDSLLAGRPYHYVVPAPYARALAEEIRLEEQLVGRVLELDPARFQPVLNVLVVPAMGASGGVRFEIRSQGRVMAASGTNWRSPAFAEIYVYSHPEVRRRGWARAVASACSSALLSERVRPLYVVEEGDEVSGGLAADLGFRDTGHREFIASGAREA